MQAIIPVAGIGTRLRPHTFTTPKALLNVAGKPMLGHILDRLEVLDIDRIVLITGYLGEQIIDYVSNEYSFNVRYAHQKSMEGLADAVNLAAPHLREDKTIVVLGDTLFDADLSVLRNTESNMIAVQEVPDPERFGVVVLKDDSVTRLIEKPQDPVSNLAIVGVYYFRSSSILMNATSRLILSGQRTRGEFQLTDAMQLMLDDGEKFGTFRVRKWFDCGKPETLLETNRSLLEESGGYQGNPVDSKIIPPVFIHDSAQVINSVIGPYVSICENVVLRRTVISNSIVFRSARIENTVLNGSLVGENAVVSNHLNEINIGDSSLLKN